MRKGVKSADRVIDLLELFKRRAKPLSLRSIRDDLGYPQSSLTTLLKTLVMRGYLNYDRKNRLYFPTMMVADLGNWISKSYFGDDRVLEALRDAHSHTGETVVLATLNDVFVQYLQVIESRHEFRFVTEAGMLKPATRSAIGWLLLAILNKDAAENIVRRANIASGQANFVDVQLVMDKINEARTQGYTYTENMPYDGGGTVCVMLPTKIFGLPLALACGGSADRIRKNRETYVRILKGCAEMIIKNVDGSARSLDIEF